MEQYRKNLGKVVLTCNDYWDKNKEYDILCLVEDKDTNKNYISKKEVPAGVLITNREYWQPIASMGAIDNGIIILNHTDVNGNIPYYDLISAAKSINPKDRRPGLILGYLNYDSSTDDLPQWKLYQYNDVDLANWLNISSWQALDYNKGFIGWFPTEEELYKEYAHPKYGMYAYVGEVAIASVIYRADDKNDWINTGEKAFNYIVNFADEEDITNKNNRLKFADKIYNPEKFNGLGRVYIRKNIVDGVNVLTQDMLSKLNTIYIIQYDYYLQDAEITVPEGCVLNFQGGTLNNGVIIGNNTILEGYESCLKQIMLSGTFRNLSPIFIEDSDFNTFINCISCSVDNEIDFGNKTYIVNESEVRIHYIYKNNFCIRNFSLKISDDSSDVFILLLFVGSSISVDKFKIDGGHKCTRCLSFEDSKNSRISNGEIINVGNDRVSVVVGLEFNGDCSFSGINNVTIDNIQAADNASGISISHKNGNYSSNITVRDCSIKNVNSPTDADGIKVLEYIDFENKILHTSYHTFENIDFENCDKRGLKLQCNGPRVRNITCKNGYFGQACIDLFGDDPIVDGLSVSGIILPNYRNCIFLSNYKTATIKNVKADNNVVTFDAFNTFIYDVNTVPNSLLTIENVVTDYNTLVRKYVDSENASLSINQVNIKVGYHYTILDYAYSKITIKNLITNKENLSDYWWRLIERNPDVLISDDYTFNIAPTARVGSSYTTKFYYTSTRNTLTTVVQNDKRVTFGVDSASYPTSFFYTNYEIGDELELPEARLRCLKPPTEENNVGEWNVICLYTRDTTELSEFINKPAVYKISSNKFDFYGKSLSKLINSEGWYAIAELSSGSAGFVTISKQWGSDEPSPSIIAYSYGYFSDIKLIHGYCAYDNTITRVRINKINSKTYLEIKYTGSGANIVEVNISNTATDTKLYDIINSVGEGEIVKELTLSSIPTVGHYELKPSNIPIGYSYFCTDRQTIEGATNGIMIYYKGNNVWVDALGRVVE